MRSEAIVEAQRGSRPNRKGPRYPAMMWFTTAHLLSTNKFFEAEQHALRHAQEDRDYLRLVDRVGLEVRYLQGVRDVRLQGLPLHGGREAAQLSGNLEG